MEGADPMSFMIHAIGKIRTCFPEKNGTPRQGILCKHTKGRLRITIPNNPQYFLDGLEQYSHCHLLFMFHENGPGTIKPKVSPPRLEGKRVGVFATRTPNAIGLTIAKIDRIEKETIFFSGVDLLDGTPIIDIKPYVGKYDAIPDTIYPDWIDNAPVQPLEVQFTEKALDQLKEMVPKLQFYKDFNEVKEAIAEVLRLDPRSIYWRNQCEEKPYGFCIDVLNIVCSFEQKEERKVKIVEIEDWSDKYSFLD